MASHSFDPEIAQKVGVNAAVLFQNILFWCEHNAARQHNIRDGKAWTFSTMAALSKLFPYLSTNQIRTALKKLEDAGLIESGNHNKSSYDRTKWYCVSGDFHLGKNTNGIDQNPKPIPDINTDINTDITPPISPPDACDGLFDQASAFHAYNQLAERCGLPMAQTFSKPRIAALSERLKECGGLDGWRNALAKVEASDFLCGRKTDWRCDLDFLLQKKSFTRLMEGFYDNVSKPNPKRDQEQQLAEWARQ